MAVTIGTGSRRHRATVEVYTRQGCGLCEEVEQQVIAEAGKAEVRMIDVDLDPSLVERYSARVPVVVVDGREVAELRLEPGQLKQAIRRAREERWADWRPA